MATPELKFSPQSARVSRGSGAGISRLRNSRILLRWPICFVRQIDVGAILRGNRCLSHHWNPIRIRFFGEFGEHIYGWKKKIKCMKQHTQTQVQWRMTKWKRIESQRTTLRSLQKGQHENHAGDFFPSCKCQDSQPSARNASHSFVYNT